MIMVKVQPLGGPVSLGVNFLSVSYLLTPLNKTEKLEGVGQNGNRFMNIRNLIFESCG